MTPDDHKSNQLIAKDKTLILEDKFEEAVKQFEQSLERDPNNIEALSKKSEALIYLGKYQEAADSADEGIAKVDPSDRD